jgi:hypothetical protein
MDEIERQEFLREPCPGLRPLIVRVLDCKCGCHVLDFFRRRPLTWLEASDIAYHLRQPDDEVVTALNHLANIGIVQRLIVLGYSFCGLTRDADALEAIEQFWVWRDIRHAHLERVSDALRLRSVREFAVL